MIDRDLKNSRNKMLLSWFKLRPKTKTNFTLSSFTTLVFFQVWKVDGQISRDFFKNWRLCANPQNEVAFFQLRCIYSFLTKCRIFVNFPGVDFLEQYSEKKNCSCLFIPSITHEIRHFHVAVMQWLIKTYFFFDVLNAVVIFLAYM